jgi:hypothetical protein
MEIVKNILGNSEMIVSIVFLVVTAAMFGASYVSKWAHSKAYHYAEQGIEFAEKIGGDNRTKLVRAVSFVETLVLGHIPILLRGFVDNLINAEKIASIIERRLSEIKHGELKTVKK